MASRTRRRIRELGGKQGYLVCDVRIDDLGLT
jgi:hypothetical protein